MPPSRNDLWLVLIIAGLCATAAGFIYLNSSTRSTNRVLRQQTASLIEQVANFKGQVKSELDQKNILLAHAADLKSLLRQVGSHIPAATLAHLVPTSNISTQDVVTFRSLDALRALVIRKAIPTVDTNAHFVANTHILKYLGVRTRNDVMEADVPGTLIGYAGFTNYVDLLLEGIIPLRINGVPLKTELRMGASK